ncbi:MAG: indole-3-glycerol phosphate synthase TrpC [Candidatus Rokubacteria bacterium]|nr:indole-3-glycerol phosphate synthase TrpC [Candidatus Rokubacteria bacterium]MBI4254448.1 indole-3-glycerol phosphate synthase TrpC [Candidatus Rokubacteria bacterium]
MSILDEIVQNTRAELPRRRAARPRAALEEACRALGAPRDFEGALRPPPGGVALVAEVKQASPSRGLLVPDFDPVALARTYAAHGAAAVSVLTDARYFRGSLEHLHAVRAAVGVPLLRKDFTLDEYHLWEARAAGADAVLLIVAVLEGALLGDLLAAAKGLGLAALVECHTAAELDRALAAGSRVVGLNNRDLTTFETRVETTLALLPLIPPGPIVVSESGFSTAADVRRVVAAGVHAVLVGEALVSAADVGAKVRELALR